VKTLTLILTIFFLTACGTVKDKTNPNSEILKQETAQHTPQKTPRRSNPQEAKEPAPKQTPTQDSPAKNEAPTEKEPTEPAPQEESATKINISYPIFTLNAPPQAPKPEPQKGKTAPPETPVPTQQAPNDSINNLITVYVDELNGIYNTENSNVKAGYSIMHKDERYASILFEGVLDGEKYISEFMSTLNIDLKTGNRAQLNQIVLIDGDFIDIVYNELEVQLTNRGGDMKTLYPYGLEDLINQADTGLGADIHSYFTQYEITLIFKVPHEFGDYITVTVPNKIQAVFD